MDNVKKSIFDEFCTKMLLNPEIKNQIYRLKLSDDCQCLKSNIFLSFFSLNEFIHLENFESILPLSSSFKHHLKIEFIDLFFSKIQTLSISKLNWFQWPTNKISSIINLTLSECELNNSYQLLEYIPMLKYLHIKFLFSEKTIFIENFLNNLHLKRIIIDNSNVSFNHFEILIKRTPNLKILTISSRNHIELLDAYRWEHLIISSLVNLNHFKFEFSFYGISNEDEIIISKFQQFKTDFWQKQHHWYTEYTKENNFASIYTIPYLSNKHKLTSQTKIDSHKLINHFNNITDLILYDQILTFHSEYYFSNVISLTLTGEKYYSISLEYVQYFTTYVNMFNIKHLSFLNLCNLQDSSVVLKILKSTPSLSSLTIDTYTLRTLLKCNYFNGKIKKIELVGDWWFLDENYFEIKQFSRIFFNLEYLQYKIDYRDNILSLLDDLPKLSTLKVEWINRNNHNNLISIFENQAQKLNIIYNIDFGYNREYNDLDYLCVINIFMWISRNNS